MELNTSRSGRESRITRLDGIRAVAIGLVFVHHAVAPHGIGWVGVQLFFVLSGMLITGILRRERTSPAFWAPFYIKRATRILPPLVILFTLAAIFFPIPWKQIGLYEVFFSANLAEVQFPGASKSLCILWSLAVEEQFYFVWPFVIRYLDRKQMIRLLLCVLALEPVLRAVATPFFSTYRPVYYLTPFQLDGLAAGSLIALLLESPASEKRLAQWCGKACIISVALTAGLAFVPSFDRELNSILFNSVAYSLVTIASASFILYVLLWKDSRISKLLSSRVFVFFGTISYGFYLFHDFFILLCKEIAKSAGLKHHLLFTSPFALVAVTVLSWASFRFYEKPIIDWGRRRAAAYGRSSQPSPIPAAVES